jgi:LysR family transcriptional regulator, regulator for metE and metH
MDLEVRHLKLVSAVASSGSLTQAGRELHLTQSALSHQLRDVESRLGAPLFLRVGKRMLLTAAGEHVLRTAGEVLGVLEQTEQAIRRLAGGRRGRLRVSAGCYTEYHWLPPVLRAYRAVCPDVDVQVVDDTTGDPVRLLLEGRLDIGIVNDSAGDARVVERPLFADEMVVIVAPGHRLASRQYVQPEDFDDETLLLDCPKEESPIYQRLLAPSGMTPASVQVVAQSGAIMELVRAGLGVAVLARWAVQPRVKAGALRALPFTREGDRRQWSAAVLKDMAGVAYVTEFIDLVARHPPIAELQHTNPQPPAHRVVAASARPRSRQRTAL